MRAGFWEPQAQRTELMVQKELVAHSTRSGPESWCPLRWVFQWVSPTSSSASLASLAVPAQQLSSVGFWVNSRIWSSGQWCFKLNSKWSKCQSHSSPLLDRLETIPCSWMLPSAESTSNFSLQYSLFSGAHWPTRYCLPSWSYSVF
jgi:hypothetical protein